MHGLDVAGQSVSLAGLVALGVIVGTVAGLYGVGGGFLLTPLLTVVLGVPLPIAVGSGLCQMVGSGTAALLRHRRLGQGELRIDLAMLAGSVVGVGAGARVVSALEAAGDVTFAGSRMPLVRVVLDLGFALFLAGAGASMLRAAEEIDALAFVRRGPLARLRLGPVIDLPSVPLRSVSVLMLAYVGLGLGFLSGLLGVGGGILLLPLLIYGIGLPIRQAAGTGILVLVVTAVSGTLAHALQGHVHLGLSLVLLIGSSVGSQVGALLSHRLPTLILRRGFVAVIGAAIVAILVDLARRL